MKPSYLALIAMMLYAALNVTMEQTFQVQRAPLLTYFYTVMLALSASGWAYMNLIHHERQ